MAIAFTSIGAKSAGGTTALSVPWPVAGVAAGRLGVMVRAGWRATATATAVGGIWTSRGTATGGTGSAADNHDSLCAVDTATLVGTESGSVATTQGGSPSGFLGIIGIYQSALSWDVPTAASATDSTHGANRSMATATQLDLVVGDWIVVGVAVDTDTALTITSPAITAPGITFGTTTRRTSGAGVTTGSDGNVEWFDAAVTAGSGTVTVTLAFTTATSQCGPGRFVRLREAAPSYVRPTVLVRPSGAAVGAAVM